MAKYIVTTQKAHIPGLKSSPIFNDFSVKWDNGSTELNTQFITELKTTFKVTVEAAGLSRDDKEDVMREVNAISLSNIDNFKKQGWITWRPL